MYDSGVVEFAVHKQGVKVAVVVVVVRSVQVRKR